MRLRPVLLAIALLAGACGDDGGTATTGAGDEASATTAAETTAGVHVRETEAGSVLVGPDGLTLYVFTSDMDGESTCYDACATLWPPVPGDTSIEADLDASRFDTVARTDGGEQLTVNGMPLYWYAPDDSPGDAKGQGFNGVWFVVDAEGSIVDAAADGDAAIDYGYGDDYGYDD